MMCCNLTSIDLHLGISQYFPLMILNADLPLEQMFPHKFRRMHKLED